MTLLRCLSWVRAAVPQILPLMRDARVPQWLKASTAVTALLIISPLDLLGDIPILGILDDATLLAILMTVFVHFATSILRQDKGEDQTMRNVTPGRSLPPSNA